MVRFYTISWRMYCSERGDASIPLFTDIDGLIRTRVRNRRYSLFFIGQERRFGLRSMRRAT